MRRMQPKFINAVILALIFLSADIVHAGTQTDQLNKGKQFKEIPVKVLREIKLEKGYHEGLFWNGADIWVANGPVAKGLNGNVWVVDAMSGLHVRDIKPIGSFTEGITRKSGDVYFVTDWQARKLYRVRIENDEMVPDGLEVSLAPSFPAGVVWTGSRLFVITWTRGMGTKFHLLEMNENANIIKKVEIKYIQEPCQMAWDGKNLWITSWFDKIVYKIDVDRYEIIGAFISAVNRATGIAWDGKHLWLTGTAADLYQLEVSK
ncbi:MAG: hypothetical protein WC592_05660 [Candidatus Omnitrophota bacterium]|nr:hypothetical protein [Candidatus Omnitrophota bacterium]